MGNRMGNMGKTEFEESSNHAGFQRSLERRHAYGLTIPRR